MKKVFAILSITAIFAACNNGSEEKTVSTDTLNAAESPLMDAVNTADSANKIILDSNNKVTDTMMK